MLTAIEHVEYLFVESVRDMPRRVHRGGAGNRQACRSGFPAGKGGSPGRGGRMENNGCLNLLNQKSIIAPVLPLRTGCLLSVTRVSSMTVFQLPVKFFLGKYRFHGDSVTQSVPSFPYLPAPDGRRQWSFSGPWDFPVKQPPSGKKKREKRGKLLLLP